MQSARLSSQTAQLAMNEAKMRFLPSLSASASQGFGWNDNATRTGNYGINASLTLFDGLSTLYTYRRSQLAVDQSDLALQQMQNTVTSQIVSAYLTILMNEEKLAYQKEVLETSQQQKDEGQTKYQVGKLLESDYQLLVANYASAVSEIDNTRLSIDNNRLELRQLLCMSDDSVIVVTPAIDSSNSLAHQMPLLDSVMAQARRALPDWQISQFEVDMAKQKVDIARASFMPSLSLNAGMAYNEGSNYSTTPTTYTNGGLNSSLTIGLSVPIFDRGATLTQYKQSKIDLQQAELNRRQAFIDLEQEIQSQYMVTQQALNSYQSKETLANAYRSSYEVYALKYSLGDVTTVEMLQQQDKYLTSLNDYLQSKYSYILAERQLSVYMGKPIHF